MIKKYGQIWIDKTLSVKGIFLSLMKMVIIVSLQVMNIICWHNNNYIDELLLISFSLLVYIIRTVLLSYSYIIMKILTCEIFLPISNVISIVLIIYIILYGVC